MSGSVEFEHFIGLNAIPTGAIFHPNGQKYIFSNGASVVIGDLIDPHIQSFLNHHDDYINCLALSASGKYIASGQKGDHSDIVIWDFESHEIVHQFEEHDHMIQSMSFSHDEKILASVGNEADGKLMFWDLSNGCIIASASNLPAGTQCLQFGGFVRDIKRRDTDSYLLCSAGNDGMQLWGLDPYSGDLSSFKLTGEVRATINRQVTAVSFSADREYLYGATTSGDYIIASLKARKILQAVQATRNSVNSILACDDGVVTGCGDGTIKLFAIDGSFKLQVSLDGAVLGLSYSADCSEVRILTYLFT